MLFITWQFIKLAIFVPIYRTYIKPKYKLYKERKNEDKLRIAASKAKLG